jgi:hypothetical protein
MTATDGVFLFCVFLMALTLRVMRLDLMEFKHDEAVAWLRARALLAGVEFPLTGLTSSKGLENFPLFIYVLALFQVLFRQPQYLVWPIAILNSVAVLFVYGAVRRIASHRVALVTTLLYAVSPCAVFLSRKIWAQDLLVFWTCALFWSALAVLAPRPNEERFRTTAAFLFCLLAVTMPQIHFAALFLLPAYGVVMIASRRSVCRQVAIPAAAGAAIGLLSALPWVWYQIASRAAGFAALHEAMAEGRGQRLRELPLYFIRQVADEGFGALLGRDYQTFLSVVAGYGAIRYLLSALVVTGGVLYACGCLRKNTDCAQPARLDNDARANAKNGVAAAGTGEESDGGDLRRRLGFAVLTLVALPLAVLAATRIPLIPSYFVIFYPLPFFFAAWALEAASRWLVGGRSPRTANLIFCVVLGLIVVYQFAFSIAFLHQVAADGGTRGEYGVAYCETRKAVDWSEAHPVSTDKYASADLAHLDVSLLPDVIVRHNARSGARGEISSTPAVPTPPRSLTPSTAPLTSSQAAEAAHARQLALRLLQAN